MDKIKKVRVFGVLFTLYGILLILINNFNFGNILTLILGVVLAFYNIIYKYKFLHYIFLFGLSCLVLSFSFLFIYGHNNNVTYEEDVIIVLGSGLKRDGVTVSSSLENRLNTSLEYLNEKEDALILVSGGQGFDEKISEASAMKNYLVSNCVDEDRIILEDKSTSTYENFEYSKVILDDRFNTNYKIVFITNDYHVFRSNMVAKSFGYDSTHIYSQTPLFVAIPSYIREILAIFKYIIFM